MLSFIGCILLLHAAYSSYEHHQLLKNTSGVSHDIFLELILGIIALNFGTIQSLKTSERLSVKSAESISPSHKYLEPIKLTKAMLTLNSLGVSEYENLESRVDFMDIGNLRKNHLNWSQGKK